MKRTVVVLMVIATAIGCCSVVHAELNSSIVSSYTVVNGVTYKKYLVQSGQISSTSTVHTLSFNPMDGYIAMPFAGYAGTSGNLETQYKCAIGNRHGYEVAGVINGGFFGMSDPYGILTNINAFSGRLGSAHLPYTGDDIAFFSDGSIKPVSYTLHSTIKIGGEIYNDLIGCFNERRSTKNVAEWSKRDQVYYYDSLCGTKCDTYFSGTEILCKKINNTDLSIGYTMVGEVLSVSQGVYGGTVGADQFILYYPDTSATYTALIRSMQPGDEIEISVKCDDASANALLSESIGIIPNVGWLVKDGVNRTYTESIIGTHSVMLATGWTAFGWKDDGTVIFMVSESGKAITMRDIAQHFIELGCNNVVRLDGGGSSAMYLANDGSGKAGYVYNQQRAVADCMLVLKRSSAVTSGLKNDLGTKLAEFDPPADYMSAEFANAERIYNSPTSMDADYKHAIMGLSGKRSFEYVGWKKQPTDGKSFVLDYTLPNCLFADIRITSLKTDNVLMMERTSPGGSLSFENVDPMKDGNRFRVELIPGGDESRTHFVLYGNERNVVTLPDITSPIISAVRVSDISADSYTVSCTVDDDVGITEVKFPTWTENNGQDDVIWHIGKIVGNIASCTIYTNEHGNECGCNYFTHIYAWDAAGNQTCNTDLGKVFVPEKTVHTVIGDINKDGEVNKDDARLISRYDVGLTDLTEEQLLLADLNNDGIVNAGDIIVLLRQIKNKN